MILIFRLLVDIRSLVFHDFSLSQVKFILPPFAFTEPALYHFDVNDTRDHNDDNISQYVCTKSHYLQVYEEMDNIFCVKEVQVVDMCVCDVLDCGIQNQALVLQYSVEEQNEL